MNNESLIINNVTEQLRDLCIVYVYGWFGLD